MWWRVNGAPICLACQHDPMDELEGHWPAIDSLLNRLLKNMNTLRVWAVVFSRMLSVRVTSLGCSSTMTCSTPSRGTHPSDKDSRCRIAPPNNAIIPSIHCNGMDECHVVMGQPTGIYATFVMTVVAEEDQSRAVWPSCPASGWTAGVDRLTSLPTGNNPLSTPEQGPTFETHGPYQHGSGFPSVNGGGGSKVIPFDPNIPIDVQQYKGKSRHPIRQRFCV